MTLSLLNRPQFTISVPVDTLALQGSLSATFVALKRSELAALQKKCDADGTQLDGVIREITKSVSTAHFPGIELAATEGSACLDELLDWPGVAPAMHAAYLKGMWEEKAKNSETPPSGS